MIVCQKCALNKFGTCDICLGCAHRLHAASGRYIEPRSAVITVNWQSTFSILAFGLTTKQSTEQVRSRGDGALCLKSAPQPYPVDCLYDAFDNVYA